MARDKKASFKFTGVASASLPTLASVISSDKLETTITYSGSSVAYKSVSDVFWSPNMILAAAAQFTDQADVAAAGAEALGGVNGQNQSLFVKVLVTNNASVANLGTPQLQVFGATAKSSDTALTSGVAVSAPVNITTTASESKAYYIPLLTTKPYLQLQLNGTSSGAAAGTVKIVMAGLVTGRDGSVGL